MLASQAGRRGFESPLPLFRKTVDSGLFLGAFINTLEKTFAYIDVILEANVPSHSHGTPNHTHTVSDPQHDHNFGTSTVGPLANPGGVSVQGSVLNADVNLNTNVASTNITISSSGAGTTTSTSGSGDEFSVQNPSVTGNYIVKT